MFGDLGGEKGRMISDSNRQHIISLINEHTKIGGNIKTACNILGINESTYYRWKKQINNTGITCDLRPSAIHPEPKNKLSPDEKSLILTTLNNPEFADLSPNQVVPILADRGIYIASESSCYRILKENNQSHHRGRSKPPVHRDPPSHVAHAPNQVWTWDITYLNGPIKGQFFFLYMIIDIFSRFIVGWEVWPDQTADHAKSLISKASLAEHISCGTLILHSDNGSPMKASSMLAKLQDLGIQPSFSRPHVSNDNPFSESLFKTCKYRPNFLNDGFPSLEEARNWCSAFVRWYNFHHHHSGIKFLRPDQRHFSLEAEVTKQRQAVYLAAKNAHPERWNSRNTRNWEAPSEVFLNRVNT